MMITPVVLAGGNGKRLWPLSVESSPKPLLPLVGKESMLQKTLQRVAPMDRMTGTIIVCQHNHRFQIAEHASRSGACLDRIILEPCSRNTAPAIALAAFRVLENKRTGLLLILPADHHIDDVQKFHKAIKDATVSAEEGFLVTFGVKPNRPETGYGYIKSKIADGKVKPVAEFVEKPDLKTAQRFLEQGRYLWNSGMFLFRTDTYLEELKRHCPDIYDHSLKAYENSERGLDFLEIEERFYQSCPAASIDTAIMEKTKNATVCEYDTGWSDVGSWKSLWNVKDKDQSGNVLIGDVFCDQVKNSYIHSTGRPIVAIGVDDLVVFEREGVLLIANKDDAFKVEKIRDKLVGIKL